jgi:hypothetical protein
MAHVFTVEVSPPKSGDKGFYVSVMCNGKELYGDGCYDTADEAKDALITMLAEEVETVKDALAKIGRACHQSARDAAKIVGTP